MNLINEQAEHVVFGTGKIIEQMPDRVAIQFSKQYGTKWFLYPNAFEGYLKLTDTKFKTQMHNELEKLHQKQAKVAAERERKIQEFEENRRMEKLKLSAIKRRSTKKTTESKTKK